jgi:hypothetical protein
MAENDNKTRQVPIRDLRSIEGAEELSTSPDMEPYLRLAMADLQGADPKPLLAAIQQLPLERRYVWRVVSALKWAFADFDSANVTADKETLPAEDRERVLELVQHRPFQFCLFLKALLSAEEMKQTMLQAIAMAGKRP